MQLVLGVGEQVAPGRRMPGPAVADRCRDVGVVDVDGHGQPARSARLPIPGCAEGRVTAVALAAARCTRPGRGMWFTPWHRAVSVRAVVPLTCSRFAMTYGVPPR